MRKIYLIIKNILLWVVGLFFILVALAYIKISMMVSLIFVGLMIITLPPLSKYLVIGGRKISFKQKVVIGLVLFLLIVKFIPKSNIVNNNVAPVSTIIPTITILPTTEPISALSKKYFVVTKVIDGDTIMVDIGGTVETVRLIGVDTPETVDPRKPVQCFGKEASIMMKQLVEGKNVILETDSTQDNKDKYNRLLRYVYLEDGILVNKKIIEDGFGFEYTYRIPYKFQSEFKGAQKMAEVDKSGLWADGACPKVVPALESANIIKSMSTAKLTKTIVPVKIINSVKNIFPVSGTCNCSKTCGQIKTCDEAYFQLKNCGCSARDADGDGVPCESLCN